MKIKIQITIFTFLISGFAFCSGVRPHDIGIKNGKLKDCPIEKKNCVSSQVNLSDTQHYITPLSYTKEAGIASVELLDLIKSMKRTKVITEGNGYIYVEFTSLLWRFVDDVEFYFEPGSKIIHVRSASRIGSGDWGVNRKRIEEIRSRFEPK
ncbi:MAG: DUF1499 domain-containing protein [Leptospira sp.]|nr:DUF1499 domain-containing protein [Leptospira sp.]